MVRKVVWEEVWVVAGVCRPVLPMDMSPSTKKNVVGTLSTTTMWQWDRLARKVVWEERCGLLLGFAVLYHRAKCHHQHATINTSLSTDDNVAVGQDD